MSNIIDRMQHGGNVLLRAEIKSKENGGFQVVFDIDTEEEAIEFHDRVAIRICHGADAFIGAIDNRIQPSSYDEVPPESEKYVI